jgi:hypothetical protein
MNAHNVFRAFLEKGRHAQQVLAVATLAAEESNKEMEKGQNAWLQMPLKVQVMRG